MSKDMLVKVEAQYPTSGGAPILVAGGGGGGGARTRREKAGRFVGGLAGGLGAIAGKHRSLGSLLQAMVSGYAQGKDLGGGAAKTLGWVTPEAQARAEQRHANRQTGAKKVAVQRYGGYDKDGNWIEPKSSEEKPYTSPMLNQVEELKRRKNQPAEEVAVTPENMRLPAEAGVIGPEHQLTGKTTRTDRLLADPSTAVPVLQPGVDFTEEELPEHDQGVIEDNPFYADGGVRVVGPPTPDLNTATRGPSKKVRVQRSQAPDPWAGMGVSPKWGQEEAPVYAPSASSELFSDQQLSDEKLQANAAAATQKVMVTPPPLPLQTTGGANAELLAGENAATFAETPVTDDKRGDGGGTTPAEDPKVAVQEAFRQGLAGSPATTGTLGNPGTVGISGDLRDRLTGAAEGFDEVGTSIDRLPVVGIRKARRGILVV